MVFLHKQLRQIQGNIQFLLYCENRIHNKLSMTHQFYNHLLKLMNTHLNQGSRNTFFVGQIGRIRSK